MSSNTAKRKSEGEGTSTLNNTKRVQRSEEGTKQLFQIVPTFDDLQTSAAAIVRFTNIKENEDIESHGELLEREFMVHDAGDMSAYQRMKQ